MKAALYGLRKILVFALAIGALTYAITIALAVLTQNEKVATQAAAIFGTFGGTLAGLFASLMSAFKGAYASGASPFSPPQPPPAQPPPTP